MFLKVIKGNSVIYSYIILFFYITVTYGQMMAALCGRNMQLFRFASVVGIATGCGLNGPEIESRWGEIFRSGPEWLWGPPSLLYNGYLVITGGKAAGAWR